MSDLVRQPAEWLRASGPMSDVVVSSRLRLARNILGFPFLEKLKNGQKAQIVKAVEESLKKNEALKNLEIVRFDGLTEVDLQFLVERHLISREHAGQKEAGAVAMSPDEVVSIMVLEEDHLRLQAFQSGLDLQKAWQIINKIDNEFDGSMEYAFNPGLGYLTACPTNVGTGLRASCMLHLPGLVLTKQVHKVLQALAKLNLAARGLYGEGTQATGNLFQFSNQMTLGQREDEIIDNLERVIRQVVEHEKEARTHLLSKKSGKFEDQIWRALGALKCGRIISSTEATQHLSLVQLGVQAGMLKINLTQQDLNGLFLLIQPAHLQKLKAKALNSGERDEARADLIREKLKNVTL
ncbi:MAG TPA: protein arginine kinase [Verrucomicrobiae bacterium]|nr:protein arginine kinase [Verrucomicrobiae bacterium]